LGAKGDKSEIAENVRKECQWKKMFSFHRHDEDILEFDIWESSGVVEGKEEIFGSGIFKVKPILVGGQFKIQKTQLYNEGKNVGTLYFDVSFKEDRLNK